MKDEEEPTVDLAKGFHQENLTRMVMEKAFHCTLGKLADTFSCADYFGGHALDDKGLKWRHYFVGTFRRLVSPMCFYVMDEKYVKKDGIWKFDRARCRLTLEELNIIQRDDLLDRAIDTLTVDREARESYRPELEIRRIRLSNPVAEEESSDHADG